MSPSPAPSRWAAASCARSRSANGGAEDLMDLRTLREGRVATAKHQRLLAGFRVDHEHLPCDVLEDERPTAGNLCLEVEAADRVDELVGAPDAREEVLEHAAIDHGLAGHRVRVGLLYTTVDDHLHDLAAVVEDGGAAKRPCGSQDEVEAVAVGEDLRARLSEAEVLRRSRAGGSRQAQDGAARNQWEKQLAHLHDLLLRFDRSKSPTAPAAGQDAHGARCRALVIRVGRRARPRAASMGRRQRRASPFRLDAVVCVEVARRLLRTTKRSPSRESNDACSRLRLRASARSMRPLSRLVQGGRSGSAARALATSRMHAPPSAHWRRRIPLCDRHRSVAPTWPRPVSLAMRNTSGESGSASGGELHLTPFSIGRMSGKGHSRTHLGLLLTAPRHREAARRHLREAAGRPARGMPRSACCPGTPELYRPRPGRPRWMSITCSDVAGRRCRDGPSVRPAISCSSSAATMFSSIPSAKKAHAPPGSTPPSSATSITMSPNFCRTVARISGSTPAAKLCMLIRTAWRSGRSSLV